MSRRQFLELALSGSAVAAWNNLPLQAADRPRKCKPIEGSWLSISFRHRTHRYWEATTARFSCEQWDLLVKDMADLGMKYLVLYQVEHNGQAFFDTPMFPRARLACPQPIQTLMTAADSYGLKFFLSDRGFDDPHRAQLLEELVGQFGHHACFYGWYWNDEGSIGGHFTDAYIQKVNQASALARRLTPAAKILVAPYGTRTAACDDRYVTQLEQLDVDMIAYQDEVGCVRATPEQTAVTFERLRRAHDRVPQRALWADVEAFAWEGPANNLATPMLPAPFSRLQAQLEAVSPFVDVILAYQYLGLMGKSGSPAFAGHPDAQKLYRDYVAWLGKL